MRISQFISSSMECSRRQSDALIKSGKVTINHKIAEFGAKVNKKDLVEVDGKLIQLKINDVYLMLNKPIGITCTAANDIPNNIIDYINYPKRIFPIGRLDKDTTGLILLTNDGSVVNQLLKEEHKQEKTYLVTVNRTITESFLQGLRSGVRIYNPRKKTYTMTDFCGVIKIDEHRFKITLTQGLNRQIRRMCRYFQYTVTALERIQFKELTLTDLPRGKWRHLTEMEIQKLKTL